MSHGRIHFFVIADSNYQQDALEANITAKLSLFLAAEKDLIRKRELRDAVDVYIIPESNIAAGNFFWILIIVSETMKCLFTSQDSYHSL